MSSWKECKLGDIAKLSKKTWKVGDELMPYIGLEHIEESKLRLNGIGSSENVASNKFRFQAGDTLFGKLRPYFRKVIKPNFDGVCSTDIWVLNPQKGIEKDFLFYFFANQELVDISYSASSGTRMPRADWDFLSQTVWNIPPLQEQKAIAEVLSSLDDKIDLLHRQNQTLESLAQTLFRQWFIEEAKEEWEEKPLSEIALHVKNNVKPSSFENKSFYHFSLPAFDNGQRATKELGSEILSNKYQVIKNSILVSKLNPRTPRIWLIDENIDEDNSICSTEFQVLYPKEENWRGFIYCYLKTEQAVQELAGASSGTSGSHQRVKPEDIFNLIFLYPDMDTLKKFDEQSFDYWRKIKINQKQIQTLENLRDTLLPKLLSGEVRVEL